MSTRSMIAYTGNPKTSNFPMDHPNNWLVFGAGAIGTYIGGSLLVHGNSVTFLEQPLVVSEVRQRGLTLQMDKEAVHIPHPNIAASLDEAFRNAPFDAAIFALKSFDTIPALKILAPYRDSMPPLICLQNGVENESILAEALGAERVIAGTVTSSIGRRATGEIIVERRRGLGLSSLHPESTMFAKSFIAAGIDARLYDKPADMKWSKLLTNLVGNATSAILDLTPAQIFGQPVLFQLEIQQLREALAVMRASNLIAVNLPGVPVRLLALAAEHLPASIARFMLQRAVGRGRGLKMPSFHIDLHSGRGQSEVDYLNGAIVRAGKRSGVPTPVNALLNQTLLGLTSGALSKDDFYNRPKALLELLPK
jgi:2-dehydropantoate 2-reductase